MKQGLKQLPKQSLALTPLLQSQIRLLSLPGREIRMSLNELIKEFCEEEKSKEFFLFKDIVLGDQYNYLLQKRNEPQEYEYLLSKERDIKSILLDQLYLLNIKEHEISIGEYLIDSINNDGRLDINLDFDDISLFVHESFNLQIGKKEIEKVLLVIQNLEPVGCGYRNILESLMIQTDSLEIEDKEKLIIKKFLKEFSDENKGQANLDPKIESILNQLNFNPCNQTDSNEVSYIRPDLIIIENVGKLEVTLNDTFLIQSLTHKLKTSVKKTSSIKKNEALSFINGLERRQKTLLEVAKFIVSKQENFLLSSEELLPLSLKQIAKSTGVSESTVSRIVRFKYLQLPNRNIPLSSLLEKKVTLRSSGGKEISPNQLTKLIIKIIKTEKKSEPLSDQKIKKYLQEKYKVSIARRTVAKYRQQAQLLPSRLRN
ncbi:MAG TPA: hypothetical protein EYN08_05495 [Gammaproteobacteria bacterium]|nr:hypothetical protein [Gammaproteobacteria bacterium]